MSCSARIVERLAATSAFEAAVTRPSRLRSARQPDGVACSTVASCFSISAQAVAVATLAVGDDHLRPA